MTDDFMADQPGRPFNPYKYRVQEPKIELKPDLKIVEPRKQSETHFAPKKDNQNSKPDNTDRVFPVPAKESDLCKPVIFRLTDANRKVFDLTDKDVRQEFYRWDRRNQVLKDFLWDSYEVPMIQIAKIPTDDSTLFQLFRQSIVRHVSVFYGDYLRAGGKAPRHFGIPECSELGLGRDDNESSSKQLDFLAGSQGDIKFKKIEYYDKDRRGSFPTDEDGGVTMMTKYFVIKEKEAKKKNKKDNEEANRAKKERKNKEKSRHNYDRELSALQTLNHPNIVHGICTVESKLQIVYPFLKGGDLVPLETDKIGLKDVKTGKVLNPDETFMPRFTRHLVEAVAHMHSKGYVHFDLKPENFVIAGPNREFLRNHNTPELEAYHLVLIDFGLSEVESHLKDECLKAGTEVTMAPEQVMCSAPVGFGTDWWGVAAGLYRVRVFWEPSIDEKTRDDLLHARDPQWGHVILPMQPFFKSELSDLFLLMLKPDPDDRLFDDNLHRLTHHPYLRL